MFSLLFFLELELHVPPPTVFLAVVLGARMAYLHVFCCISPSLLVFCRGIFGDSFQALPELCASRSPPLRVSCCVALSPPPWPCPSTEPWVPWWLPLNPCEGRNIPPPAATIEPSAGYHVAFYTCFQLLRLPKLWLWLSDPAGKPWSFPGLDAQW